VEQEVIREEGIDEWGGGGEENLLRKARAQLRKIVDKLIKSLKEALTINTGYTQ
jgi:hypothetical protein